MMVVTMDENWLPVVGYEGLYEVSDQGRVKGVAEGRGRRRRVLAGRGIGGYTYHTLTNHDGVGRQIAVHHLVLTAFIGPRPEGMEGCHTNDVSWDNRLANLTWDTHSNNIKASKGPRLSFEERLELIRNGA